MSDEANPVPMNDGSLYATYRTIDGYSCHAYSRDGGHTWTPPEYMTYSQGGRKVKHPRAANFVKKFSNGRYLYWFHNHGGEAAHSTDWTNSKIGYYRNRNPAFVLGGIERNGLIHCRSRRFCFTTKILPFASAIPTSSSKMAAIG